MPGSSGAESSDTPTRNRPAGDHLPEGPGRTNDDRSCRDASWPCGMIGSVGAGAPWRRYEEDADAQCEGYPGGTVTALAWFSRADPGLFWRALKPGGMSRPPIGGSRAYRGP